MNNIIETIVSVPFAVAITAILRKKWPSIDGAYVYLVVLLLTIIGAVLGHYQAHIPTEVWVAAGPLLATILSVGAMTAGQHLVNPPSDWPTEAPTKKEGK